MTGCNKLEKLECKTLSVDTVLSSPQFLKQFPEQNLYLYGEIPDKIKLAIVGTRKASARYIEFTYNLSKSLAERGICIFSGLAYGVDIAAHRGALASKTPGSTVAVLATPLTKIYPASHTEDVFQILKNCGSVLTLRKEVTKIFKSDFIRRNLLIAAMVDAVLVIQAPKLSGALSTARFALELGKDVMAVPGTPWDKTCEGTNQLIKDGAFIVTEVNDVLNYFNLPLVEICQENIKLTAEELALLSLLKTKEKCFIEDFFSETKMPYDTLIRTIGALEAKGIIELTISDEVILKRN